MKVKELREKLSSLPDDMLVVASSDPEGNSYSPLGSIAVCKYVDSDRDSHLLDQEDIDSGYYGDEIPDSIPALVIWPSY